MISWRHVPDILRSLEAPNSPTMDRLSTHVTHCCFQQSPTVPVLVGIWKEPAALLFAAMGTTHLHHAMHGILGKHAVAVACYPSLWPVTGRPASHPAPIAGLTTHIGSRTLSGVVRCSVPGVIQASCSLRHLTMTCELLGGRKPYMSTPYTATHHRRAKGYQGRASCRDISHIPYLDIIPFALPGMPGLGV